MGDVDYRCRAGAVELEVHCNTDELDSALKKMDLLVEKTERLKSLGVEVPGVAVAAAILSSPRKLSRRSLFGLLRIKQERHVP